jgi:hypothetical protein
MLAYSEITGNYMSDKITILPYLIELPKAVKNGLCDESLLNKALNSIGNSENRSTCLKKTTGCESVKSIFGQMNTRGSRLSSSQLKNKQQQLRTKTYDIDPDISIDWSIINSLNEKSSKIFTSYLLP